jgi:hypothetical protein
MRSWITLLLLCVAIWQLTGGWAIDLAEATVAITAAWFVSLFLAD